MNFHFLQPGELFISKDPLNIKTLLGSCIAVCIWDKRQHLGGINHYLLPEPQTPIKKSEENKYACFAIPSLLRELKNRYHCRKEDLIVKIIGGASIYQSKELSQQLNVGQFNIQAAHEILKKFHLSITASHVGGLQGRQILFNTLTGELRFQKIANSKLAATGLAATGTDTRYPIKPTSSNLSSHISLAKETSKSLQKKTIRVLIIDDSKPVRLLLRRLIEQNPSFEVVGEAEDPYAAMEFRRKNKVDVITLDINMPKMDGVTYLKSYARTQPIPTIMITDYNISSSGPVFEALENGAFDYLKKPALNDIETMTSDLHDRLIAAFESGQRRAKSNQLKLSSPQRLTLVRTESLKLSEHKLGEFLIFLGASTGGTEAIKQVLLKLPAEIPPLLIVQHIPPVFSKAFADRLNELCPFQVKEAQHGDKIEKNCAYVAPGGQQMKVQSNSLGTELKIALTDDPPVNRFKPSVDYLFQSGTAISKKKKIGIILTGMGQDGAKGLQSLKKIGTKTIAQNEESSVVFGMPKAAIDLGAADQILDIDQIATALCKIIQTWST